MHATKCFFFRKVQVLIFQTHCFTLAASFFSMKNLHQKIIEKKWKNWKIAYFLLFYWKSWKVMNLWIFRIFSDSWKCIIRISFNANYMKLNAFESLWHILYRKKKLSFLNLLCFLVALRTKVNYGKSRFLWNFIFFKKIPKISCLNGNRNRRGLRQDWKFFYFQKIWIIGFQTPCLWCFYDQYSSR